MQKGPLNAGILFIFVIISALSCGCFWDTPQSRPQGSDGGLQWAYDLAYPSSISLLDYDALLVEASGYTLMPDGRLPANLGRWELTFASYTKGKKVTITVDNKGVLSKGSLSSSGQIYVLGNPPGVFPDSPAIFKVTDGKGANGTRTVKDPVRCFYDSARASFIWSIPIEVNNKIETHLVRWDGIYIGME